MHWKDILNQNSPKLSEKVLQLDTNDDIMLAYKEFWTQILNDAIAYDGPDRIAELQIDLCTIQSQEEACEDQGRLSAYFVNSAYNKLSELPTYCISGRVFDFFYLPSEDNKSFYKRELPFVLAHYQKLKDAAQQVGLLFKKLADIDRQFDIKLSTASDWFDMQVNHPEFGTLPAADQAVLNGITLPPRHQFAHLMPAGMESFILVQELSEALVEYTPPNFKEILFEVKPDSTNAALWYSIECPQHPEEGTNVVSERVIKATEKFMQAMPAAGSCGFRLRLQEQIDGQWKTTLNVNEA